MRVSGVRDVLIYPRAIAISVLSGFQQVRPRSQESMTGAVSLSGVAGCPVALRVPSPAIKSRKCGQRQLSRSHCPEVQWASRCGASVKRTGGRSDIPPPSTQMERTTQARPITLRMMTAIETISIMKDRLGSNGIPLFSAEGGGSDTGRKGIVREYSRRPCRSPRQNHLPRCAPLASVTC